MRILPFYQKYSLRKYRINYNIYCVIWHTLTSFSESPLHLLTILEAEILKNVVLHSVAIALANRVFPVPKSKNTQNI